MRRAPLRVVAVAVTVCLSVSLFGCELGVFRVLIPDFVASQVTGLRVFRVQEGSGELIAAGRIEFGAIQETADGERMPCFQRASDGQLYGPLDAAVRRRGGSRGGVELDLPYVNEMSSGWFRVASFNAAGVSSPSQDSAFLYGIP